MASTFNLSNAAASAEANAVCNLSASGTLAIYDGTQPATSDDAVTTQTKLAQVTFGSPAYHTAVDGAALAFPIAPATGLATGTAAWFRVTSSAGAAIFDGSVGTSGCDLNLDTIAVQAGALVTVTTGAFVQHKS